MTQAPEHDTRTDHLGWQMIRKVHETLKIDEEWIVWHDDGFTWWSYTNAQRFRFDGPHDVDGTPTTWVTFETEVLRNVPCDNGFVKGATELNNRMSNLFVVARVHVPHGRLPVTPAGGPDLAASEELVRSLGFETTLSDDEQVLHVTIPGETSSFELELNYRAAHPNLGAGLLALLSPPPGFAVDGVNGWDLAARLNEAEWLSRTTLVASGAWVATGGSGVDSQPRPVHAVFYPNLSLKARAADNVIFDAVQRVSWLKETAGRTEAA